MRPFVVQPLSRLKGEISLPGDKSIAHRAIILAALCRGKTGIKNFPANKDSLETANAFRKLGIKIKAACGGLMVFGKGLYGLRKPKSPIFINASGTTFRLLMGVLAGQDFSTALKAGKQLAKRPMLRVSAPLRKMGAIINSKREEYPPIAIQGGNLRAITYKMPVASAQVKSAILLAGLFAKGKTCVKEPLATRDHTERMLKLFKADIKVKANTIVIRGKKELVSPGQIYIPGDISSASFFLVLASILPGSQVVIRKVGLSSARIGVIRVLKRMGAVIQIANSKSRIANGEPIGNIIVKSSKLKGATIKRKEIPSLIDELPILMVAASVAAGKTVIDGVGELRVKETDRIRSMSENLRKMAAKITVSQAAGREKIVICGVKQLRGAKVKSFGDHRTAMSMVAAGACARGLTQIDDISCIAKSFPEFLKTLNTLSYSLL